MYYFTKDDFTLPDYRAELSIKSAGLASDFFATHLKAEVLEGKYLPHFTLKEYVDSEHPGLVFSPFFTGSDSIKIIPAENYNPEFVNVSATICLMGPEYTMGHVQQCWLILDMVRYPWPVISANVVGNLVKLCWKSPFTVFIEYVIARLRKLYEVEIISTDPDGLLQQQFHIATPNEMDKTPSTKATPWEDTRIKIEKLKQIREESKHKGDIIGWTTACESVPIDPKTARNHTPELRENWYNKEF